MNRRRLLRTASILVVASLVAGIPTPAEAQTGRVFVYDNANFDGTNFATIISASHPNLAQIGWAGRISSLRVVAGISIAVYSEPNYGGTCDTFVGRDPWLGNNRIGNDRIASIRLFHNCLGPVVDPVVANWTAVRGDSDGIQCPVGYVKREMDLNATANGDFIYLCLSYGSKATVGDDAFATVTSVEGITSIVNCGTLGSSNGGTRLDVDLNAGAGGFFVYLCNWTKAENHPDPGVRVGGSLRDVEFIFAGSFESLTSRQARCRAAFEDVATGTIDEDLADVVGVNLNSNIFSADPIYACRLNYDFELADPRPRRRR